MRTRLNELNNRINRRDVELEKIRENNKNFEKYHQDHLNNLDMLKDCKDRLNLYILMLDKAKNEDREYKQNRLDFLQDSIDEQLSNIFPNTDFSPKLVCSDLRNRAHASLVLVDETGRFRKPKNSASGLMKQTITFTGAVGVARLLGSNKVFIDEGFGAASPENRGKIGNTLSGFINTGMQMILISQGSELYQDLERREIHLRLNDKNEVEVVNIEDLGGE